jgi:hypothetical protein
MEVLKASELLPRWLPKSGILISLYTDFNICVFVQKPGVTFTLVLG